jgi:hypothetical protein
MYFYVKKKQQNRHEHFKSTKASLFKKFVTSTLKVSLKFFKLIFFI